MDRPTSYVPSRVWVIELQLVDNPPAGKAAYGKAGIEDELMNALSILQKNDMTCTLVDIKLQNI